MHDGPQMPVFQPEFLQKLLWVNLIQNFTLVGIFYLNIFFLIPRVLQQKKLGQYLQSLLLLSAIFIFIVYFIHQSVLHLPSMPGIAVVSAMSELLFILLAGTTYNLIAEKIAAEKLVKEEENERLKMELGFLRSQISPHFIFNVLNNIVSLSRLQPAQVEPTLLKLSGIMRYMLYEMNNEKITLGKEIEYLNDYIDLQMQRFDNSITVERDFSKVNTALTIEPLLLIPFVENAFKYGQVSNGSGLILLKMQTIGNVFYFETTNRVSDNDFSSTIEPGGIGQQNVRRRLKLLYNQYFDLKTSQDDSFYIVKLKIELL